MSINDNSTAYPQTYTTNNTSEPIYWGPQKTAVPNGWLPKINTTIPSVYDGRLWIDSDSIRRSRKLMDIVDIYKISPSTPVNIEEVIKQKPFEVVDILKRKLILD